MSGAFSSKGRTGSFRKLHPDPEIRLATALLHWCGNEGFAGQEAEVRAWAELHHPKAFKSAVGYLADSFSTPLKQLLNNNYRAYLADTASKAHTKTP